MNGDNHGVCSRNYDIEYDVNNAFWGVVIRDDILEKLRRIIDNHGYEGIAVQGVQGNKYKLQNREFCVFDIFDIKNQKYVTPEVRRNLCNEFGLRHVPLINPYFAFHDLPYPEVLVLGDGKSMIADVEREGIVLKNDSFTDHTTSIPNSFKIISNSWLLKNE